jgi:N-methylhydantoinase A
MMLDSLDAVALDYWMVKEAETARRVVEAAGLSVEGIDLLFELDMHYLGQTHTVSVPVPVSVENGTTRVTAAIVRAAFERAYLSAFSRLLPGLAVKIVTLRTAAIGRRPHFDLAALAPEEGASLDGARRGTRQVWFASAWRETSVWARLDLPVDAVIEGPAVLEQDDATTLIDPGLVGRVDRLGNVIVERKV